MCDRCVWCWMYTLFRFVWVFSSVCCVRFCLCFCVIVVVFFDFLVCFPVGVFCVFNVLGECMVGQWFANGWPSVLQ